MCLKPFRHGVAEFGCGQCMPCRVNRRRLWSARLMLEQSQHQVSHFVTLTYNDESLPEKSSLVPGDMQDWLKRLRTAISPRKLRYYGVGEYGERGGRPHYHVLVFGPVGRAEFARAWGELGEVLIDDSTQFKCHTDRGLVHVGNVTLDSIGYVVSYVCKRMTSSDDPRLGERHPEFARMSLKPGIGAGAIHAFVHSLNSRVGARFIAETGGLPPAWRSEGKLWPFGRYIGGKIREELGFVKRLPYVRLDHIPVADRRLVERALDMRDTEFRRRHEGRRIAGGLKVEFRDRLRKQRRVL